MEIVRSNSTKIKWKKVVLRKARILRAGISTMNGDMTGISTSKTRARGVRVTNREED